jgi:hypothetical protein
MQMMKEQFEFKLDSLMRDVKNGLCDSVKICIFDDGIRQIHIEVTSDPDALMGSVVPGLVSAW